MRKVDLFILLLLVVNSLFIVANIALAQNYSASLITNSEGIGISNRKKQTLSHSIRSV